MSFAFLGEVCGGRDLLGRQRVARIEYAVYAADATHPVEAEAIPCTDQPLELSLEAVPHRVVVRGYGDDGERCWDTGDTGVDLAPVEGAITVHVSTVCMLNDAVRLSVEVAGPGDVLAEPSGIDCPSLTCDAIYDRFAGVRLTAVPHDGAVFGGWSLDCGGGDPVTTVAMIAERACRATFVDPGQPASWSESHLVGGPEFGAEWDAAVEGGGPLVVFAGEAGAVDARRAEAIPQASSDWSGDRVFDASSGAPLVAIDTYGRTWVTATGGATGACRLAVATRAGSHQPFLPSAEIELSSCVRGRALAALEGGLLLAATDPAERTLVVHAIEGDAVRGSAILFEAATAYTIRHVSPIVMAGGNPAFAFSTFDRDQERGELWLAVATIPRPSDARDWSTHALLTTADTPEAPAILAAPDHLSVAFGTISNLGRATEARRMQLAISSGLAPRRAADWRIVTVDPDHGGAASVLRHRGALVIAYGDGDTGGSQGALLVASSAELAPSGPDDFAILELDQTVLAPRPRLLPVQGRLGILYQRGPAEPLVFRSPD